MKRYFELFYIFARIGLFTLGGGYVMIPLIQKEIVENRKWVSDGEFVDMLGIAQSIPGVMAVNLAISAGYRIKGVRGSVAAAMGAVLPSFSVILVIAVFLSRGFSNPIVESIFSGIRPAVAALIAVPVINTAKAAGLNRWTVWVPVAGALLIWPIGVSPVYVILACAAGGFLFNMWRKG